MRMLKADEANSFMYTLFHSKYSNWVPIGTDIHAGNNAIKSQLSWILCDNGQCDNYMKKFKSKPLLWRCSELMTVSGRRFSQLWPWSTKAVDLWRGWSRVWATLGVPFALKGWWNFSAPTSFVLTFFTVKMWQQTIKGSSCACFNGHLNYSWDVKSQWLKWPWPLQWCSHGLISWYCP